MSYQPHQNKQMNILMVADDVLAEQALAGDQASFEALVNKYESSLREYVRKILKDDELTADVLQLVFLQLYLSLPKLKPNQPLRGWLFRVSYYRALDELRKRRRRQVIFFSQLDKMDSEEESLFVETILDGQPTPEDALEWQDLHESIMRALQVLPPKMRSIVHLHCFGELPFSEIGKQLDIPMTTVKTAFYRALPRLRAVYKAS